MYHAHRYPTGHYIDQIVGYAHTSIPEDESGRVRCNTFRMLNHLCKFIAANEDIPESKVYPALRFIGYNVRYHRMKSNDPDPLQEIGKVVKECVLTRDVALMGMLENSRIFQDTISTVYRMPSDAIAVAMKDAEHSSVQLADLNLYNVLEGVSTLLDNEPDYVLLRDDRMFAASMDVLMDAKNMLQHRCVGLKAILGER